MRLGETRCLTEVLEGSPMVSVCFWLETVHYILHNVLIWRVYGAESSQMVGSFVYPSKGPQNYPKSANGTVRVGKPLVPFSLLYYLVS